MVKTLRTTLNYFDMIIPNTSGLNNFKINGDNDQSAHASTCFSEDPKFDQLR